MRIFLLIAGLFFLLLNLNCKAESPSVVGSRCPKTAFVKNHDSIVDYSGLKCELQSSGSCANFFGQLPPDFKSRFGLRCPDLDDEAYLQATGLCSGLVIAASLSAWRVLSKTTQESIVQKIPKIIQKVGPKIIPYLSVLSGLGTIYSVVDVTVEALAADKTCFENIEKKKAILEFLKISGDYVADKTKPFIGAMEQKMIQLPSEYLKEAFIQKLTCQQLNEIVLSKKKNQDSILGPLMAQGKIHSDPRKELALDEKDKVEAEFFLKNSACLSTEKRVELLCALGNSVMGGLQLKKSLGTFKADFVSPKRTSSSFGLASQPNVPVIDAKFKKYFDTSGLSQAEAGLVNQNAKSVVTIEEFLRDKSIAKDVFLLGSGNRHDPVYGAIVRFKQMRPWDKAWDAVNEIPAKGDIPAFLEKLTSSEHQVYFLLPKNYQNTLFTAKEIQWLLQNPDKMKKINFVLGAEDKIPRTDLFENIKNLKKEYGQ